MSLLFPEGAEGIRVAQALQDFEGCIYCICALRGYGGILLF
ncbi:hypothetical protein Bcsk_012500 [Bartonella sp. CDC_skunk]|nr:hypothetical protein [Bartonella sp. CDC_skunk]AQX21860.1 hypothetical protein Bcsk_012500 [Bartonella sp. CDC_skunk]